MTASVHRGSLAGKWRWIEAARFALALALLGAAPGCRPEVRDEFHDPDFTPGAIERGGIAIVGFESAGGDGATIVAMREKGTQILEMALAEHSDAFSLVPSSVVRRGLGNSEWHALLTRCAAPHGQDSARIAEIRAGLGGLARYAAVAILKSDQEQREEKQQQSTVSLVTSRIVVVEGRVYDLETHRRVWSGLLRQTASAIETYDPDNPGGIKIGSFRFGGSHDYPAAPELDALLSAAVLDFGKALMEPARPRKGERRPS